MEGQRALNAGQLDAEGGRGGGDDEVAEEEAEVEPEPVPAEDDDPHTREEEFVRNLVETLDATEEEIA